MECSACFLRLTRVSNGGRQKFESRSSHETSIHSLEILRASSNARFTFGDCRLFAASENCKSLSCHGRVMNAHLGARP
jgi:hypothetical protein